ncbi:MAG: hypothetical protein C5B49_07130 [Bdellovibrio sp.]|nr:MAG: hypothetical protein C5B49_07130 [Bdellovibrio sp.]
MATTPGKCREINAVQEVELSETEAKFLVPDISKLPSDILHALRTGAAHPSIQRRGFVAQEYLPVNRQNLERFFSLLNEAGIPFGSKTQQDEYLVPGKAKEIRMMSKSIKIGDTKTVIFQATVKGSGGLSVRQIESFENLTPDQVQKMRSIFESLRPEVSSVARKVYFEVVATAHDGQQVLRRRDGTPYTVEIDMFLGKHGIEHGPDFVNAEIEFHGATPEEALAEATLWQRDPLQRPSYFSEDLTEAEGVKSREIAVRGPPEFVTSALAPYQGINRPIFEEIAREFSTWADSDVTKLVLP